MGDYHVIEGAVIMRNFSYRLKSKQFRIGIALLVSLVALYLALREVNLQEVWVIISKTNWNFIVLALLSVIINNLLKSERWQILLSVPLRNIRFSKTFMVFMIGQMFNNLFPARSGELSRIILIGGKEFKYSFVVGTLMVEKSLDIISYGLLIMTTFILIPIPEWLNETAFIFLIVSLLVMIALLIIIIYRHSLFKLLEKLVSWLSVNLQTRILSSVRTSMESIDVFYNRGQVFKLAFLTTIIWGTAIITNQFIFSALGLQLPITAALLVLVTLIIGISIPSLPGKIGIFEYSCVLALSVFGVNSSIAFSYGLLLHIIIFLPPVIIGLFSMWVLDIDQKTFKFSDNQ